MSSGRAVIFDMDGVLIDSYAAHFATWRDACAEHDVEMSEAVFAAGFGRTSAEVLAELWPVPLDAAAIRAIEDRKESLYRERIAGAFPAVDGARSLVTALHDAGFRLAVGSSGPPENVEAVLDALALRDRFAAVVTGRDVTRGKPDPQVFAMAAARLGVPPADCAVIEDAVVGIQAAHAAGMSAIGYVGTGRTAAELASADLVVDSLRALTPDRVGELIAASVRDRSRTTGPGSA